MNNTITSVDDASHQEIYFIRGRKMDLSREDNLRVEVLENATVVQFASGPIRDEKKIYDALESLNQYAASNGDSRLVLDLTNIET